MTPSLQRKLRSILDHSLGQKIRHFQCQTLGGGSINQSFELLVNHDQRFFAKINSAENYPGLFAKEAAGLALLAAQHIFRIPAVIAFSEDDELQWIILEWIQPGFITTDFWKSFGERLAALHAIPGECFGLADDNYMGALTQSNKRSFRWDEFFILERLEPQLRLAFDRNLVGREMIADFENLYPKLPGIFPPAGAALLHGDLWSGNFICDEHGEPVLVDPAVYYGHPAMDLGMTELFGGFDEEFYQSYANHFPLPSNFREQRAVCRLYPLLIHLNLFGRSYLGGIREILAGI